MQSKVRILKLDLKRKAYSVTNDLIEIFAVIIIFYILIMFFIDTPVINNYVNKIIMRITHNDYSIESIRTIFDTYSELKILVFIIYGMFNLFFAFFIVFLGIEYLAVKFNWEGEGLDFIKFIFYLEFIVASVGYIVIIDSAVLPFSLSIFAVILLIYSIPSLIAYSRKHHNFLSILFTNWLLGFTILGWIIALIWSVSALKSKE
jgi:hypothetical protein